jgi:hypothetical protein
LLGEHGIARHTMSPDRYDSSATGSGTTSIQPYSQPQYTPALLERHHSDVFDEVKAGHHPHLPHVHVETGDHVGPTFLDPGHAYVYDPSTDEERTKPHRSHVDVDALGVGTSRGGFLRRHQTELPADVFGPKASRIDAYSPPNSPGGLQSSGLELSRIDTFQSDAGNYVAGGLDLPRQRMSWLQKRMSVRGRASPQSLESGLGPPRDILLEALDLAETDIPRHHRLENLSSYKPVRAAYRHAHTLKKYVSLTVMRAMTCQLIP